MQDLVRLRKKNKEFLSSLSDDANIAIEKLISERSVTPSQPTTPDPKIYELLEDIQFSIKHLNIIMTNILNTIEKLKPTTIPSDTSPKFEILSAKDSTSPPSSVPLLSSPEDLICESETEVTIEDIPSKSE